MSLVFASPGWRCPKHHAHLGWKHMGHMASQCSLVHSPQVYDRTNDSPCKTLAQREEGGGRASTSRHLTGRRTMGRSFAGIASSLGGVGALDARGSHDNKTQPQVGMLLLSPVVWCELGLEQIQPHHCQILFWPKAVPFLDAVDLPLDHAIP